MEQLTKEQKSEIRSTLERFVKVSGSANKAAVKLGVSSATLSAIRNGKDENVAHDMWLSIAAQLCGVSEDGAGAVVETAAYRDLMYCFQQSRYDKRFMWAVSAAGSGKTVLARSVAATPNTYYVLCDEDMNKGDFTSALARAVGIAALNQRPRQLVLDIVKKIRTVPNALLIIDEADKLSDNLLNYFITIYNHLEDMSGSLTVGVVFVSTSYIQRRMNIGLEYNKRGYSELWSRLGAKFYEVDANTAIDVEMICRARGVVEQKEIDAVIKEAESANYDLRRVSRKINVLMAAAKRKEAGDGRLH